LIVDRTRHEVREGEVRLIYKLIEDVVIPLITDETAKLSNGRQIIAEAIKSAANKYLYVPGSDQ
jgi:hypothetical protein